MLPPVFNGWNYWNVWNCWNDSDLVGALKVHPYPKIVEIV